jgi:hypothetical protein
LQKEERKRRVVTNLPFLQTGIGKYTLENTEGTIKNEQSRETGNILYTNEDNKNKYTTQYGLETTISKQTQIT